MSEKAQRALKYSGCRELPGTGTTSCLWALAWDGDRLLPENETSIFQKHWVQAPWWNKLSCFASTCSEKEGDPVVQLLPWPIVRPKPHNTMYCMYWCTIPAYCTHVLDLQSRDLHRGGHLNCSVSNITHFSLYVRFGKKGFRKHV